MVKEKIDENLKSELLYNKATIDPQNISIYHI